jgi:hypothetical protein
MLGSFRHYVWDCVHICPHLNSCIKLLTAFTNELDYELVYEMGYWLGRTHTSLEERYRKWYRMECFMFCRILSSSWESVSIEVNAPPISTTQWNQKLPFDWLKIFVRLYELNSASGYDWTTDDLKLSLLWKFISPIVCVGRYVHFLMNIWQDFCTDK